jgi:hypothetical protein
MKKFTSLLICCSLALAGAAMAQQPDETASPAEQKGGKKKHAGEAKPGASAEKPQAAEAKPGANPERGQARAAEREPNENAAKGQARAAKAKADADAAKAERSATTQQDATAKPEGAAVKQHGGKAQKAAETEKPAAAADTSTNVSAQPAATAAPDGKQQHGKGKGHGANATVSATPAAATSASAAPSAAATAAPTKAASATPTTAASVSATPATTTSATTAPATAPSATAAAATAPSVSATTQTTAKGVAAKKPDPQKVEQIKSQYTSFRAQPKPQQVPTVTFQQNYRIQGSDRWQGPQYEVYRSYRPERHDQGWYRSRYQRVELVGGGYYYLNNGYWYPAWGYSPREEYYAYDAPIYAGRHAEPPDRVIAKVQAVLQDMGYYRGEVDGLLGPLTREALTGYQADQGLATTAVIDEPTLDSLGMTS